MGWVRTGQNKPMVQTGGGRYISAVFESEAKTAQQPRRKTYLLGQTMLHSRVCDNKASHRAETEKGKVY